MNSPPMTMRQITGLSKNNNPNNAAAPANNVSRMALML
jgi:hypothetical protein